MQTRTYGDLFKLIQSLAGVGSFAPTEADDIANLINRRFLQAFNESPIWPRYLVTSEERDIISLNISGLGAGSSIDQSSVINGNYILLGQDSGDTSVGGSTAVAGSNVYYNPAVGSKTSTQILSTVIYKDRSTKKWKIDFNSQVNISGSKITTIAAGSDALTEADTDEKDNPSKVVTWTLTTEILSGTPLIVDKQLIPYAQTGKKYYW